MYSMAVGAVWDLGELSRARVCPLCHLLNAGVPLNCQIYSSGWWDISWTAYLRRVKDCLESEYRSEGMGFGCSL